MGSTQVVWAK